MAHTILGLISSRRNRILSLIAGTVVVAVIGYLIFGGNKTPEAVVTPSLPTVSLATVSELASTNQFTAVGTVAAISEARLQTEAGGRVVSVNTEIGARVAAGQVLATIENSAQRAALTQAEGAYEAARAAAVQGNSGVRNAETDLKAAKNNVVATVRNAFTSVNNILITTVDPFYSNPQTALPIVRVGGTGKTQLIRDERVAFRDIIPQWQMQTTEASINSNLPQLLDTAERHTKRMIALIDIFIAATTNAETDEILIDKPLSSYAASVTAARTSLNGVIAAIENARTSLSNAEEAVVRANVGGTDSTVSAANAQVKQALGSLQAAQAAYAKTLVRSPISGTVNALYLKAGEYVSPSQPAAIVANNNGLEITTAINQEDSAFLEVGDTVVLDDTASGTITAIAGAVDPTTGKIAVKVSVNENSQLQNGSTVAVTFTKETTTSSSGPITIPLSAVKMTGNGPVVFGVGEDNKLTATPITLGPVSGNSVVINEGISSDVRIVTDARGLKEGQEVAVSNR